MKHKRRAQHMVKIDGKYYPVKGYGPTGIPKLSRTDVIKQRIGKLLPKKKGQLNFDTLILIPIMLVIFLAVTTILTSVYPLLDNSMGDLATNAGVPSAITTGTQTIYHLIPLIIIIMIIGSIYLSYRYRQQQPPGYVG